MDPVLENWEGKPAQIGVAEQLGEVGSAEYRRRIEQLFALVRTVVDPITELVEADRITPELGGAMTSCLFGQVFGYQEFHGSPNLAQTLAATGR